MKDFFYQNTCSFNSDYSIVIEDDNRVAYLYLLKGEELVGDVWLYNRQEPTDIPEWDEKKAPPFLNPIRYCKLSKVSEKFRLKESDILVHWGKNDRIYAQVRIGETIVILIEEGSQPGWSNQVKANGPLARILEIS